MRKLTVRNFSVIEDAELEFGKITVLIGPQASGKSLLCKLAYFLGREVFYIAEGRIQEKFSFISFLNAFAREFEIWFPRSGWGSKEWCVFFEADSFRLSVSGGTAPEAPVTIAFSESFQESYIASLADDYLDTLVKPAIRLRNLAGAGVWDRATFIPSERTYFVDTSKDYRALATDPEPLTSAFAVIYANSRDPGIPRHRTKQHLKGKLTRGEEEWQFRFDDGRTLPLGKLSSGTKELLPLLSVLEMYEFQRPHTLNQAAGTFGDPYRQDDFFIEEPEGHIFPDMQRNLVHYFAELTNSQEFNSRFTITTHSPYILSAFNNLIMAGQVAKEHPDLKEEVAAIIPEQYWIGDGAFRAYCIHDGVLKPILSKSGLIDGEYLDSVSDTIGNEFDSLLRLEYDRTQAS